MNSAEGERCETNRDCPSNVCKMIYRGPQPIGRRCLNGSGGMYTKNCRFPKDCLSGVCEKIYDNTGKFVAKKCAKAQPVDRDNPMDKLMGKTSGYEPNNQHGIINDHTISMIAGEKGPVSKLIFKIISIAADIFTIFIYDFSIPSYRHREQGVMYSIFATVALNVFYALTYAFNYLGGGLISGPNKARFVKNTDTQQCESNSRPIDMFYIRTIMTIMFPPLGVLMAKGFTGFSYILTSCLLTSLFYFPGLIYSFSVISSSKHALLEEAQRKIGRDLQKQEDAQKT
jgi:uncharacterized membrane protein YqaE (UPF0057 family)